MMKTPDVSVVLEGELSDMLDDSFDPEFDVLCADHEIETVERMMQEDDFAF